MTFCQTDVGAIQRIVVKHARDAFGSPDFTKAVDEYDRFVDVLRRCDLEILFLPRDERVGLDSIYARDTSIVCEQGVILCNMGKHERRSEPAAVETACQAMGIPIHGAITGEGRVEGGDVVWIDQRTLAVGRGYRTNDEGIRQLRELLRDCADELVVVPLPHWRGPGDVFHLMSIISPIDDGLALVYSPLLPVPFREALARRGTELVEVPDAEFPTMGCNVLAVAPRKCIVLAGNPQTRARLEQAGVEAHEFEGAEICAKGAGGPTCLTRPVERSLGSGPESRVARDI